MHLSKLGPTSLHPGTGGDMHGQGFDHLAVNDPACGAKSLFKSHLEDNFINKQCRQKELSFVPNTDKSSLTRLLYHEELDSHSTHAYYSITSLASHTPQLWQLLLNSMSPPPGMLFWLNYSQMPPHVPRWGGGGAGSGALLW